MKRIALFIFLSLIIVSSIFSISLDEIISGAKELSPTYQNMILSYENSLINIRSLENKDKIGVSVSATVNPLYEERVVGGENGMSASSSSTANSLYEERLLSEEKGMSASSSATLTLPNNGNTTISLGAGVTALYDGSSTVTTLSLGASHVFDFTGYNSSDSEDLTLASTKYSTELSKNTSELNFEKTVINTVSALLGYEKNIKKLEKSYNDQKALVDKMDTLGTYSTTSTTYINAVNVLNQYEASLESAKKQYENAKANFEKVSGMEWTELDELPEPVLDLKVYDNGNTSVLLKSLSVSSAAESYKAQLAKENPMNLSLSGKINGSISDTSSTSISGTVAYTGDNWSLSVAPGVSITIDKTTPTVTISGSWSNGGTQNTNDDDTLKAASNKVLSAENDYRDALSSYFEDAQSLSLRILSWQASYSNSKAALDYANMVYENEKAMYEYGFSTEKDVNAALLNVISAEYDLKTTILDGLSLERDLKIFAL